MSDSFGERCLFWIGNEFVSKNPATVLKLCEDHGCKYQRMGLMKSDSVLHAFEELIFTFLNSLQ